MFFILVKSSPEIRILKFSTAFPGQYLTFQQASVTKNGTVDFLIFEGFTITTTWNRSPFRKKSTGHIYISASFSAFSEKLTNNIF